jgi:hypothetical protein
MAIFSKPKRKFAIFQAQHTKFPRPAKEFLKSSGCALKNT